MCVEKCQKVVSQTLNRRGFLKAAAAATLVTAVGHRTAEPSYADHGLRNIPFRKAIDLTHTFRAGFPVYAFDNPARETIVTVEENGFYSQSWTLQEHAGTHMDAPGHFIAGGRRTPQIEPEELIVPLVVVDIRAKVAQDPDALVSLDDLQAWEKNHGRIPKGSCVAMYSGWEQFVGDQDTFRGTDSNGVFHFPGFGLDAVDFLLEERSIHGIAVDTLSLDHGPSTTFDVHIRLLGADRWGLENVANLGQLPPRGATIVAAVIPWEEGSGGPCRVLGLVR